MDKVSDFMQQYANLEIKIRHDPDNESIHVGTYLYIVTFLSSGSRRVYRDWIEDGRCLFVAVLVSTETRLRLNFGENAVFTFLRMLIQD